MAKKKINFDEEGRKSVTEAISKLAKFKNEFYTNVLKSLGYDIDEDRDKVIEEFRIINNTNISVYKVVEEGYMMLDSVLMNLNGDIVGGIMTDGVKYYASYDEIEDLLPPHLIQELKIKHEESYNA